MVVPSRTFTPSSSPLRRTKDVRARNMVNIISKLTKPLCKLSMHHLERAERSTVRVQCVDVEALVPPGKRENKVMAGEFVWHLVHYLLVHIFQRREIMLTHTKDSVPVQARVRGFC